MFRLGRRPRPVRLTLEPLEPRDVPGFLAPVSYAVGNNPQDVATADVNGDGRLDVIVAVQGDNNVAVLLGNGDGTLQRPALYPAGTAPYGVAVADLNGDGRLDIVVANYWPAPYLVSVLLGNGNGTFGPPHSYGGANHGSKVAIGDVDGDHVPDVAVDSYDYGYVWVFHGNGDGTLGATPQTYGMPWWFSLSIHIADLDGDGVGDVVCDQYNYVTVIYSGGAAASYPSPGHMTSAVADVNRDGRPDVIHAEGFGGSTVGVLLNRGDGVLLPPAEYDMRGGIPGHPVVADFNGDRKPDIAASFYGAGNVGIILGKGDGTFQTTSTYPAGNLPWTEAAGDLNHDRYPDLVTVNRQSQSISVLLNNGNWAPPVPPPGPGRLAEPPAAPGADAGRYAMSSARVQVAHDDAAVPGTAPPAVVAYRPPAALTAIEVPEALRVFQEPFARWGGAQPPGGWTTE
jgi:hypothetical protein